MEADPYHHTQSHYIHAASRTSMFIHNVSQLAFTYARPPVEDTAPNYAALREMNAQRLLAQANRPHTSTVKLYHARRKKSHKLHIMKTRNFQKYNTTANTNRYKRSPILHMKKILNNIIKN